MAHHAGFTAYQVTSTPALSVLHVPHMLIAKLEKVRLRCVMVVKSTLGGRNDALPLAPFR